MSKQGMIPKFRAWDKEKEKMLEVANISFDKEAYGYDLITIDKAKESPTLWTFNRLEDFALMQSTGLKDKNGVEIFEGDILSFTTEEYHSGVFIEENHIGEIEFCDGAYLLKGYLLFEILSDDYESKIIGNIHQNPELLEVAE